MPSYRIVVLEHTSSPKAGKFVEKVGTYNPKSKERVLDTERIKYWMSVGAQPSATVHNMLVSLGIIKAKKINVLPSYKEPGKEEVKAEAAAAPAPEAPAEASAAEAPAESTEVAAKAE